MQVGDELVRSIPHRHGNKGSNKSSEQNVLLEPKCFFFTVVFFFIFVLEGVKKQK